MMKAKKPVAEPVLDIFDPTAKWHVQEDGTIIVTLDGTHGEPWEQTGRDNY